MSENNKIDNGLHLGRLVSASDDNFIVDGALRDHFRRMDDIRVASDFYRNFPTLSLGKNVREICLAWLTELEQAKTVDKLDALGHVIERNIAICVDELHVQLPTEKSDYENALSIIFPGLESRKLIVDLSWPTVGTRRAQNRRLIKYGEALLDRISREKAALLSHSSLLEEPLHVSTGPGAWEGNDSQLMQLHQGLIASRLINAIDFDDFQNWFKGQIGKKRIQWNGTEPQIVYLFERLNSYRLLHIRIYGKRHAAVERMFLNRSGEPFKAGQLSVAATSGKGFRDGKPIKKADVIDKLVESLGV